MPSYGEIFNFKKEFTDCIEEAKKLLTGKVVKVGDKYGWPTFYQKAFDNEDLKSRLNELFNGYGFTVTINGSNQFEVTGTI